MADIIPPSSCKPKADKCRGEARRIPATKMFTGRPKPARSLQHCVIGGAPFSIEARDLDKSTEIWLDGVWTLITAVAPF